MHNKYWVIIPAAGQGERLGSTVPKQYLDLLGKKVIEYSLDILLALNYVEKIIVAVAVNDPYWKNLKYADHPKIQTVIGGEIRYQSVYNAILYLENSAQAQDWVLVHDAARPCVRVSDIHKLVQELTCHPVGGILGAPVSDTIKKCTLPSNKITGTAKREHLWHAFTPQLFRYAILYQALKMAESYSNSVTDESSAVEKAGYMPQLVKGYKDNIKITTVEDLNLARYFLEKRK